MSTTTTKTPTPLRRGFTLVELLIVVLIVGILASLAVNGYRGMMRKAHVAVMRTDMAHLVQEQEMFFHVNLRYGALAELTEFRHSAGSSPEISWLDNNGFAAVMKHTGLADVECGYFIGDAPNGVAGPATEAGQLACDD